MNSDGTSEETAHAPAWTQVGESCARALVSALVVGSVEAAWVARATAATPAGFGLVMAGLWLPPMLVLALVASRPFATLARDRLPSVALAILYALAGALAFFTLGARASLSAPVRIVPLEVVLAIGATLTIAALRMDGVARRSIAIAGIVGAVSIQLFSARWIDAHRAYVSVIGEQALLPKLILRVLFPRAL